LFGPRKTLNLSNTVSVAIQRKNGVIALAIAILVIETVNFSAKHRQMIIRKSPMKIRTRAQINRTATTNTRTAMVVTSKRTRQSYRVE